MKYLVSFELFNEGKLFHGAFSDKDLKKLNYTKPEVILDPDITKLPSDNKYMIKISDSMIYKNRLGLEYNPEITIILNDKKNHDIFSKKRVLNLTWLENKEEFLSFLKVAFNKIYPEYFFKGVKKINDIDLYSHGYGGDDNYIKEFALFVTREDGADFSVPYNLSKRYNEREKRYDMYINIRTVVYGNHRDRKYQIFNFHYDQPTNEVTFEDVKFLGLDNYRNIPENIKKNIRDTFEKEDELRKADNKMKPNLDLMRRKRIEREVPDDDLKEID